MFLQKNYAMSNKLTKLLTAQPAGDMTHDVHRESDTSDLSAIARIQMHFQLHKSHGKTTNIRDVKIVSFENQSSVAKN